MLNIFFITAYVCVEFFKQYSYINKTKHNFITMIPTSLVLAHYGPIMRYIYFTICSHGCNAVA